MAVQGEEVLHTIPATDANTDIITLTIPHKDIENGHLFSEPTDLKENCKLKNEDRAVTKHGETNFRAENIQHLKEKFFTDIFTTIVEVKWRWTLLTFCTLYFGSWIAFAVLWYLIVILSGPDICIEKLHTFTAAFLFSVETQHTTGYGFYQITEHCPSAITLFCIQSIFGVILEGALVGLVFVKISQAKKRSETLMFSRNAVISMRDGILCFMFRVGDMRKSHLLEAHVRAQLIKKRTTDEGEIISYHQQELEVGGDGEKMDKILLFWPTVVVHKITPTSPLYNISAKNLYDGNSSFEIIVVLEGIVESTGLTTQARSSYLPLEILWDHRFMNLTSKKTSQGDRIIDYALFHKTFKVDRKSVSSLEPRKSSSPPLLS